jgi:hypothetical protein
LLAKYAAAPIGKIKAPLAQRDQHPVSLQKIGAEKHFRLFAKKVRGPHVIRICKSGAPQIANDDAGVPDHLVPDQETVDGRNPARGAMGADSSQRLNCDNAGVCGVMPARAAAVSSIADI